MSKLIDLIVFPMHDWKKCEKEGFRTRDAHLTQHFEKNKNVRKILVVDRPITLPEMILKRKSWRVRSGEMVKRTPLMRLTRVSRKIYVLDIFSLNLIRPIILKRDWWNYIFSKYSMINKIRKAISILDLRNRVLFLWSPLSVGVVGKLGETMVVFDALDNWIKHPEMEDKRGWIRRGYEVVKKKADIIFVNSQETQKFIDNPRTSPIFIPNGVDKEFFVIKGKRIPEDLKNIPKPVVGYAGKLAKRIDVALLSFLAKKLPGVSFVLIGQFIDENWIMPLFQFENIYLLGDKHYNRLPQYLANFDVCIIPHNVGDLESGGDPTKLYEYLAAGKPVVTTNIAGVDNFQDALCIAYNPEEFVAGINKYLRLITEGRFFCDKLRNRLPDSCSWEYKANLILDQISENLDRI